MSKEDTIRLSVEISRDLFALLETLAAKLGKSKSNVLRNAILLMDVAVEAKEKGQKIGIAGEDGALVTEIVNL